MSRSDMINNFLDAMSLIAKDAAESTTADQTVIMEVVDNLIDILGRIYGEQ